MTVEEVRKILNEKGFFILHITQNLAGIEVKTYTKNGDIYHFYINITDKRADYVILSRWLPYCTVNCKEWFF